MSLKVRRGLGLLAVAAVAALAWLAFDGEQVGAEAAVSNIARIVAGWCTLIGLALIAWGLLRD